MLIKTYGEHWRKDLVNWSRGGRLEGFGRNQSHKANFWKMKGVYALYDDDYKLVYVGQSYEQGLGRRLKQHTRDESRGRWSTFSWYGVMDIVNPRDKHGWYSLGMPNQSERASTKSVVESFETLVIRIADPDLNRRRQGFKIADKRAVRCHQFQTRVAPEKVIERLLRSIEKTLSKHNKKLDKILKR
jgi:hypothetical protein